MKNKKSDKKNLMKNTYQSYNCLVKIKQLLLAATFITISFISSGFGQSCANSTVHCNGNGIGVSETKVFDNRSLVIMLEELNRQLQNLKIIDQKTLLDNLGLSQGFQSQDTARSFEFGTVPIPGLKTTSKPDSGGNLEISEQVKDQKEITAKTPGLPDLLAAPKYEPKFGINSEDLLTQQIDLTYKIFNLRMLLERSVSDRLMTGSGAAATLTSAVNFTSDGGEIKVAAPSHGFPTGIEGRFTTTGTLPDGLKENTDYYIIRIDSGGYKIAKSYEDALYGRAVSFTNAGAGIHTFTPKENGTRLQTVVGLNVSLDPPREKKDMAAFVELSIKTADGKPISVVALMPQEKTYNSSALSSKSNAFGGSAVIKVFTVGYSERRRGQTFYLYQDADTITYQKMPSEVAQVASPPAGQPGNQPVNLQTVNPPAVDLDGQTPIFGWEFRPVLGRRSVSPGMRQVFAVISLNKNDVFGINDFSKLKVEIKTYWRKYDRKTLTVYNNPIDDRKFTSTASVPTTNNLQNSLQPIVKNARWTQLDDKNLVLTVNGENFFTGMNVLVGGSTFDSPVNGLTIKSEQSLQLRTTIDAIGSGEVILNGRYGASQPILLEPSGKTIDSVAINNVTVSPLSDKTSRVYIYLKNKSLDNLSETEVINPLKGQIEVEDITKLGTSLIRIGNNTFALGKDNLQTSEIELFRRKANGNILGNDGQDERTDKGNVLRKKYVLAIIDVPSALVKEDALVTFKMPFMGEKWTSAMLVYYGAQPSNIKISKIEDLAGIGSIYWITGNNLGKLQLLPTSGITITPSISNDKLIAFQLNGGQIAVIKNIVLMKKDNNEPVVLPLPKDKDPESPPVVSESSPLQVFVNDSKTVTFKGKSLKNVRQALFEGKDLQIIKNTDEEIIVFLTREVTKSPGGIEIVFKFDNNVFITGKLTILKQPEEPRS